MALFHLWFVYVLGTRCSIACLVFGKWEFVQLEMGMLYCIHVLAIQTTITSFKINKGQPNTMHIHVKMQQPNVKHSCEFFHFVTYPKCRWTHVRLDFSLFFLFFFLFSLSFCQSDNSIPLQTYIDSRIYTKEYLSVFPLHNAQNTQIHIIIRISTKFVQVDFLPVANVCTWLNR